MSKRTHKPDPTQEPRLLLLESFDAAGAVALHGLAYQFQTHHNPGDGLTTLVYLRQYGDTRDPKQVSLTADGRYDCTCEDYIYREKAERGETCKHIDALVCLGILPRSGVSAPADVCPACNGTGTHGGHPDAGTCWTCGGDGELPPLCLEDDSHPILERPDGTGLSCDDVEALHAGVTFEDLETTWGVRDAG